MLEMSATKPKTFTSLFALVDPADPRLTAARSALANALF